MGEADTLLCGKPEITFFKAEHKQHTPFAMSDHETQPQSQCGFGKTVNFPVPRNGDLVSNANILFTVPGITVSTQLHEWVTTSPSMNPNNLPTPCEPIVNPSLARGHAHRDLDPLYGTTNQDVALNELSGGYAPTSNFRTGVNTTLAQREAAINNIQGADLYSTWANGLGHCAIDEVAFFVGGTQVDCHSGEWLFLTEVFAGRAGADISEAVGYFSDLNRRIEFWNVPQRNLLTPLKFHFCGTPGLAVPLIGLHYHDLKLTVKLRELEKLVETSHNQFTGRTYQRVDNGCACSCSDLQITMFYEFVLLAGRERKAMAGMNHQFLFIQTQAMRDYTIPGIANTNTEQKRSIKLEFNHPVSAIFFMVQQQYLTEQNLHFNYVGDAGFDPITKIRLTLNSQDRFVERTALWCRTIEPYRCNLNIPKIHAYVLSFAISPLDPIQSSGTINFSKIETVQLILTLQRGVRTLFLGVFAAARNVFRVRAGLGGPMYAA